MNQFDIKGNEYTYRGRNSVTIVFSILKRVYSKKKNECAPLAQIFPFRVDPFSELTWCTGEQTESHKSGLPCENGGQSTKCIQSPEI